MTLRHIVLVLGDELDAGSAAFDGFDPARDAILQMEVREEATYIREHKRRLAFFFAAMRHFRDEQRAPGRQVFYSELDDPANLGSFAAEVRRRAAELNPHRLILLEPGDWRVQKQLCALGLPLEIRADRHFLCSHETFASFADEHPRLVLETFYRFMRRRLGVLLEPDGAPSDGKWNFDAENRAAFRNPPPIPAPRRFPPDATRVACSHSSQSSFRTAPGGSRVSTFRSRARTASKRSTTSSPIGWVHSAPTRTPCSAASRFYSTRVSRDL